MFLWGGRIQEKLLFAWWVFKEKKILVSNQRATKCSIYVILQSNYPMRLTKQIFVEEKKYIFVW